MANESKFTLRRGGTEFLRIQTEHRLRGYPCRTIPLIVQQRPWNARPVKVEAALDHVAKAASTVRRRIPDPTGIDSFVDFFLARSCHKFGLDERLLSTPTKAEGLGLKSYNGSWAVQSWSAVSPPPVVILNQTKFRQGRVQREFDEIGVPVKAQEAQALAGERIRAKIAADNIPEFAGVMRRAGRNEIVERVVVHQQLEVSLHSSPLGSNVQFL